MSWVMKGIRWWFYEGDPVYKFVKRNAERERARALQEAADRAVLEEHERRPPPSAGPTFGSGPT